MNTAQTAGAGIMLLLVIIVNLDMLRRYRKAERHHKPGYRVAWVIEAGLFGAILFVLAMAMLIQGEWPTDGCFWVDNKYNERCFE